MDNGRDVAAGVDDRVPATRRDRVDDAITAHLLGLREEPRIRLAAVEERDLVAALDRRLDHRPPEELGAAENEEFHGPVNDRKDCLKTLLPRGFTSLACTGFPWSTRSSSSSS